MTLWELHFAEKETAFVFEECFEIFPVHVYKFCILNTSNIYTKLIVIIVFDRAENRSRAHVGDCCLKSFKEKADYFILTITSEKTIQLITTLLHHFCDFLKTFESSQVEDSCANK